MAIKKLIYKKIILRWSKKPKSQQPQNVAKSTKVSHTDQAAAILKEMDDQKHQGGCAFC